MTTRDGDDHGSDFTLKGDPKQRTADLPRIDFFTFVLSLATSAWFHMGLTPDRSSGAPSDLNLPLARQTIDTLEMLEEKTRGNLDTEEAKLLESVLYELRMGFVKLERE